MGVVRYLCITIALLACFACAANAATCVQGAANNHGDCVCRSGFTGAACDTEYSGDNCAATYAAAVNDRDGRFPKLDETLNKLSFRHNTLQLSIAGQVVPNRTYTDLYFIQPAGLPGTVAPQCKLSADSSAASFWTQSQDANCHDRFALSMNWASWRDCGFDPREQNSAYYVFRATFVLQYTDFIGAPFSYEDEPTIAPMTRRSSVSYKVWVMFLKSITLDVMSNIAVNNTIDLKIAITTFEYNPQDLTLTLGISTIMKWPAKFIRSTVNMTIIGDDSLITTGLPTQAFSDDTCLDGTANPVNPSPCMQYFEFKVKLASANNCTFDAAYKLIGTATTCRDAPGDCTQGVQEAYVTVLHSDVCGHVTANPVISGALRSYDVNHAATTEYTIGYRGYFEADMATANDFNLTWVDIWVVPDSAVIGSNYGDISYPQIQWLYRDGQVLTTGFNKWDGTQFGDFGVSPVNLHVTDVTSDNWSTGIGSSRVFTPKFDFRFDSRIFNVPFETAETKRGFTLHARGHIVYAGNEQYGRKREVKVVDYVFKTDAAEMSASVAFELAKEESTVSDVQTSSNVRSDLLKSLLPVAGIALVVVAAAIAAAVVIVKRRSTKYATLTN